tara:strand:+ start:201 stop:470 length:270 start_codon:yes stop_codon:yes gene_type:complete
VRVRLRGKYWELVRARNLEARGDIDSAKIAGKRIRVSAKVPDDTEELLEVVIHECLHGLIWDLSEEAVQESAVDLSKILYKLGARIHLE